MWGINLKTLTINIRYVTQLFFSYVLLLSLAISGLVVVTSQFFYDHIQTNTVQRLLQHLTYLEYHSDPSDMTSLMRQLKQDHTLQFTIIASDGRVTYDSDQPIHTMDNHLDRPEIRQAKHAGWGTAHRYSTTRDASLVYVAKTMKTHQIYRLALPIESISTQRYELIRALIPYAIIVFSGCLLLTIIMSRWISSPLKWTTTALKRINAREFDLRPPPLSIVKEINTLNHQIMAVSQGIRHVIQKISKEKEKKDIVLNNMLNGLVVVDDQMTLILMNQAAYSLCFNESDVTKRITITDYPALHDFLQDLLAGNEPEPMEMEYANSKQVLITGSIYRESESPRGILIGQDITRLKRLESTRKNFVANVSHELKTPITLIRGMVETILTSQKKGIEIPDDFLQKALAHTDRLTNIIDDLLQLSRLETTADHIDTAPTDLNEMLDIVDQQCRPQAIQKNMTLVMPNVGHASLVCNATLIIQAIKNLVDNAIKYAPNNSTIRIEYQVGPTTHQLRVIDEGRGIAANHISKLFQRFYRVDAGRSRRMGGTGLGLAIVKHIAQAHGGQAGVQSEWGKGSTFWIDLPQPSD